MAVIRWAVSSLLFALAATAVPSAYGQPRGAPLRVHVRGSAQIEAVAWSEPSGFVVRGMAIDDAGSPIARAPLLVQAASSAGARVELPPAVPCLTLTPDLTGGYRSTSEGYAVETDERGAFCVRGQAALDKAALRVRFRGSKLYEEAEARVAIDASQAALAPVILRFETAADAIDLDRDAVSVTVALRIDRSDGRRSEGAAIARDGLVVALEDERGAKLGEATTGGDGRARFEVKTASLDGPGAGELRARFDGSAMLAKASAAQSIVRRAQATLALSHPIDPARADDGVPIDVDVSSARGPVDRGVIEALRGGEAVGAGTVADGKARVIASFIADREGSVPVSLRYVPSAPWWRPGPELAVSVPIAGPGVFRQLALGALVLAIAGWVVGGWRRAPKAASSPEAELKAVAPVGRAGVRIMGPSEGAIGWRGLVTDAHDGTPIARAELSIVVPTFEGTGVVTRVLTDDTGAFALDGAPRGEARLVVRAAMHSGYEQALPPPSTLGITLVTRRRALLDRLVRWARRQGAPFEGPPEPTPGHVRRVATRNHQLEIEVWAGRIEHAAFGPAPVDEQVEQDIAAGEPKPGAPRPAS